MKFLSSITIDQGLVTGLAFSFIQPSDLPISGVVPGGYTNPNLLIDQFGRITSASNGSGGGGSGTVTTVSVVTANGVSGSVANPTTTPALTISLGAITPTSVAASGTISASNFSGSSSGTNTGDQTIPTLDAIPLAVANVSINTHKLTSVVDPTNPQDAATKNYVDTAYTGTAPIAVSSKVISLGLLTALAAGDVGITDQWAEYNAANAANNTITTDRMGGFLNPQLNDFRLTALSGTAVPTTDQTGATSIYLTPKGNIGGTTAGSARIVVYDGTRHREYLSAELSLSISSLVPGTYDVFVYDNSGTLTLETLAWTAVSTGSITGATNATPIVITSTAHGLANDQLVFISGVGVNTAANGTFRVAGVAANTFNLTTLAGANVAGNGNYTSGGTWWRIDQNKARATAIDLQDGVWYKHGALTRRYLGTIRIVATGLLNDAAAQRCVWNATNRVARHFWAGETATNWSYTSITYRPSNNNLTIGRTRVQTVLGLSEEVLDVNVLSPWFNSSNPFASSGIGLNSNTATSALSYGGSTQGGTANAKYLGYPTIGALDIQQLESSNATGTTNWYGIVTGTSLQQNGLFGTIWA